MPRTKHCIHEYVNFYEVTSGHKDYYYDLSVLTVIEDRCSANSKGEREEHPSLTTSNVQLIVNLLPLVEVNFILLEVCLFSPHLFCSISLAKRSRFFQKEITV